MKLQPDRSDVLTITGYGPGWVGVNGQKVTHHLIVSSQGEQRAWECADFRSLEQRHFALLADLNPELVVFGSGNRLRFPAPGLLRTLIEKRIGVETMDTLAACRTYNILAGEGRHVVAALIIET